MSKVPSPEERPDLYDGYDCQEAKPLSEAYFERTMPEAVKRALAARQPQK